MKRHAWLILVVIFLWLFVPSLLLAQQTANQLPLKDRVKIATQLYHFVEIYFGHWRGVPDLDLDQEYGAYLDQILATDDRRSFDLASMELIAKLKNGHSGFGDSWLRSAYGQMLGFYAYPVEGKWVITRSNVAGLRPGDIISRLDGQSFESFFQAQKKYISGSDERWVQRAFFEYSYLFPHSFNLELEDGRSVSIVRKADFQWPGSEADVDTVSSKEGVLYIRIPSFDKQIFEQSARTSLHAAMDAKAVVLDVRGNHGGNTPVGLVKDLMERPYRWVAESTPMSIGLFQFRGSVDKHAELAWFGDIEQPISNPYRGEIYILADGGCFSACEDFLIPFKNSRRATIIGVRSAGSSGQPAYQDLGDGMGVSVSTKREYFPDGSTFEGVGVAPDIEVNTSIEDLRTGRDPVMAKLFELIHAKQKP
jgi:carboxyl-terminal processing protease